MTITYFVSFFFYNLYFIVISPNFLSLLFKQHRHMSTLIFLKIFVQILLKILKLFKFSRFILQKMNIKMVLKPTT